MLLEVSLQEAERDKTDRRGEGSVTTKAEIGVKQGTDSPLMPPEGVWPC